MYLDKSSGPLMEIKRKPQCLAAAPANKVFPVPGGPYNSNPDCKRKGEPANKFEY